MNSHHCFILSHVFFFVFSNIILIIFRMGNIKPLILWNIYTCPVHHILKSEYAWVSVSEFKYEIKNIWLPNHAVVTLPAAIYGNHYAIVSIIWIYIKKTRYISGIPSRITVARTKPSYPDCDFIGIKYVQSLGTLCKVITRAVEQSYDYTSADEISLEDLGPLLTWFNINPNMDK